MKCSSNRCIFFFFLKYTKLYKKCSRKRLNVDICKPPLTRRRLIRPNVFFHKSKHLIMRKRSQVSIDMAYSNEIFFSLFKRVQLSESTVVFALFFFSCIRIIARLHMMFSRNWSILSVKTVSKYIETHRKELIIIMAGHIYNIIGEAFYA